MIILSIDLEMRLLSGMFGWVKGSGFLSKVVERTKTVTENVITTLDPQMKEFIHSGGDIEVKHLPEQFYFHPIDTNFPGGRGQ